MGAIALTASLFTLPVPVSAGSLTILNHPIFLAVVIACIGFVTWLSPVCRNKANDPIAEAEIYSKFNDIAGDKTAIYISHRLSSCKFCDEIAVFHEGAVIQRGTHEELVADEGGKYYALWNAQAQYYTAEAREMGRGVFS